MLKGSVAALIALWPSQPAITDVHCGFGVHRDCQFGVMYFLTGIGRTEANSITLRAYAEPQTADFHEAWVLTLCKEPPCKEPPRAY